jgi:FtsZ-binding cell division protein ZapB
MENTTPAESTASAPNRKPTIILTVLVVILAIGLGLLFLQYNKMKSDNAIVQEALEEQKKSLTNELQDMMSEYEGLKSDNDSLNKKIDSQQDKIKNLLAVNYGNIEKIKLYKKELTTLREIMKSYIVQIDSLNTKNQKLISENTEVRSALDEARKNNDDLSKEKEDLNSKVQMASVLSAKDVVVTPLNKRGKNTERASRVLKIQVCFTIRENSIIPAGEKIVFLRLTRPDDLVLATSEQDVFDYDSKKIVYSAKRSIAYENKDVDLCIFWDNAGQLIPGNYKADLFSETKLIGSATFVLK